MDKFGFIYENLLQKYKNNFHNINILFIFRRFFSKHETFFEMNKYLNINQYYV